MIIIHDDGLCVMVMTEDDGNSFGIQIQVPWYGVQDYAFKTVTKHIMEENVWESIKRYENPTKFMKWKVGENVMIKLTRHPIDYKNLSIGFVPCWNIYKMMPLEIESWKWGTQVPNHIQEI